MIYLKSMSSLILVSPSKPSNVRHHNPFGHSSWRDSLYLVPGPATKPGLGRRPLKDRPAPQPPEAKDAKDKRAGRKKAEEGYKKASDRAYKAFNQVRAG